MSGSMDSYSNRTWHGFADNFVDRSLFISCFICFFCKNMFHMFARVICIIRICTCHLTQIHSLSDARSMHRHIAKV
jgi:hypothetical protein